MAYIQLVMLPQMEVLGGMAKTLCNNDIVLFRRTLVLSRTLSPICYRNHMFHQVRPLVILGPQLSRCHHTEIANRQSGNSALVVYTQLPGSTFEQHNDAASGMLPLIYSEVGRVCCCLFLWGVHTSITVRPSEG